MVDDSKISEESRIQDLSTDEQINPTSNNTPEITIPLNVSNSPRPSTITHHHDVQEILHTIETEFPHPNTPKRPVFSRFANALSLQLKKVSKRLQLTRSKTEVKHEEKHENRFQTLLRSARQSWGASELIRELRAREEEYLHQVEESLTKEKANQYAEDHPYVALRKRIENMARTGKEEYRIQYEPLLNKPKVSDTEIPIYSTGYENERRKQARRRQFMFGLGTKDRFDSDVLDAYFYNPNEKPDSMHWASKTESDIAFLALIFSVSNLFRFPHACYVNGGIIFFLVYCLIIVSLIRPLIFFEMLIGQFSWKGEWGFGGLHRFAKGFPHALTFVNLTFITLNNAILGYAGLYAVGSIYNSPGQCDPQWTNTLRCIPYDSVEKSKPLLIEKMTWIKDNFNEDGSGFQNASLFLSTELFFRFYVVNWKGKFAKESYHWKFVLTFMVVMFVVVPASLHSHLVSTISRIWIYFSCILPIFLSFVLFHQYAFRDGYNTPRYFSVFNWSRLVTFTLWRDAFEMAFTTVGVGYGVFIRVAASNDFRFNKINQTSWIISITAMTFSLLCSMVVYTELAILGLLAEAKEFTHIFAEGFGVSFVCLSGAILKILPTWAFAICFAGLNIFNVWTLIVATHTTSKYISHMIPAKQKRYSLAIGMVVTVSMQTLLISIYAAHADYATTSFDLYGGAGAACTILLAEIGIAFVLWGFREFMTDIEIMLDKQPSFLYQVQMKYFIPPALLVAMFMISLSWLHSPPTLDHTSIASYQTYYFAICINTMPAAIMTVFAFRVFRNQNKVAPVIEETKFIEKSSGLESYWKNKSRWSGRRGAVTHVPLKLKSISMSHASLNTNYAQNMSFYASKDVYFVHTDLKWNLNQLLSKTKSKALWRMWANKVIAKKKIKTLVELTHFIMRRSETKRLSVEAIFLKNLIRQCSICNLATSTAKHFEGKSYENKELIMLDHLLKNTDLDPLDDEDKCLKNNGLQTRSGVISPQSDSSGTSISSDDSRPIYSRILGRQIITPEEVKLDVIVRIKKALSLPCEKEMSELRKMRSLRFYNETNAPWWSIINPPPEEKFIKINVIKRDQLQGIILNIRVIILRCSNHFVLQRLPVPRPVVVQITNEELESLPGDNTNRKVSNLVIRSLKETLWKADLNGLGPENKTPLLDNLDLDIYRFIDPVRSCVVILESEKEAHQSKDKWRWLTKPTRRQYRLDEIPIKHTYIPFEIEEMTIARLIQMQNYNERIDKMLMQPSDIVYHRPDEDVWTPEPRSLPPSRLSSSTSNFNEETKFQRRQEVVIHKLSSNARHQLVDETVLKQNRKAFRKSLDGNSSSTTQNSLSNLQVKHLTNYDWKNKRTAAKSVQVLHKKPNGLRKISSVKFLDPPLLTHAEDVDDEENEITETNVEKVMDVDGSVRSIWSKAEMRHRLLVIKPTDKSTYSVHVATTMSSRTLRDYINLKNDYDELTYYTDDRTLIVERKDPIEVIVMASSEDSIASTRKVSRESMRATLTRTDGKTELDVNEYVTYD